MRYCPRHQRAWYPGGLTRTQHGAPLQRVPPHWYALSYYTWIWALRLARACPSGVQIITTPCDACGAHRARAIDTRRGAHMGEIHPATRAILRYFVYEHLPERLQVVSRPLCDLAHTLALTVPQGPELTAGLRKLLEAKDCFVRAAMPVEADENG